MSVQWFPGHMNKARKIIDERMKSIDVVAEILDARLPGSSLNPLTEKISRGKAQLKIINKADLADPDLNSRWAEFFRRGKSEVVVLCARDPKIKNRILQACRAPAPARRGLEKPLRVMICGVPNVGKSTLINTMLGKKSAKTGNEPGITKNEQRLLLADDCWLYDTPGMLWPKIIVPESGFNLAVAGCVGRNAVDEQELALYLIGTLKNRYPEALPQRYGITDLDADTPDEVWAEAVARRCGAVLSGGRVDAQKAAEVLLRDFRAGSLGRITLETPEEWCERKARAEIAEAEKRARAAQIKAVAAKESQR